MTIPADLKLEPLEPQTKSETGVLALGTALVAVGVVVAIACVILMFLFGGWLRLGLFGGVLFGALLAWRLTRDDRNVAGRMAGLALENGELQLRIEELEDALQSEQDAHAETKKEVGRLKLQVNANRHNYVDPVSTTDPVHEDAMALINAWVRKGHIPPNQREMVEIGWTPQRYASALDFLAMRGVVDHNKTRPVWLANDRTEAIERMGTD